MREELLDSGMIVEKDVSVHELLEAVKVLCFAVLCPHAVCWQCRPAVVVH